MKYKKISTNFPYALHDTSKRKLEIVLKIN